MSDEYKWISVDERLPDIAETDDSECILSGRPIAPAHYSEPVLCMRKGKQVVRRLTWIGDKFFDEDITHWQPLPAPP